MAGLSILVAGILPVKTLTLPIRLRDGPIIIPDITPPGMHPALSPMLIGIVVARLCAGIIEMKCLSEQVGGNAIGLCAVLGYGIGVGIGPAGDGTGVRHTSGKPKSIPANEQFANIVTSICINLNTVGLQPI